MNIAIAISHKERPIASLWARWIAGLGLPKGTEIFLTFDQKVDEGTFSAVYHTLARVAKVDVEIYFGDDPGYPGGANRMFVFTARRASKADKPFLWMETDMTPVEQGWIERVEKEYNSCGKPFMGPILSIYSSPHMNGTAVYPANWEEITNIAECPDHYPWDTFSRSTVTDKGQAANSRTLKHVYNNRTFPRDNRELGDCIVFHPCKDGSLIRQCNESLKILPEEALAVEPIHILIKGFNPWVGKLGSTRVNMTGASWYVARLNTTPEQVLAFRGTAFQVITEKEYLNYINQ